MKEIEAILVVDDHRMVCDALVALIERTRLSKKTIPAYTGAEALDILRREHITIILVDIRMPGFSGRELVKCIEQEYPRVKIVGMTSFDDEETLQEMFLLNLDGTLLKRSTTNRDIYACLEAVGGGKRYFTDKVHEFIQKRHPYQASIPRIIFTYREMQVLRLLSEGQSSKLIAEHLGLKPATIEDYRKAMLKKTNSKSTAGLVALAMRNGLL